MSIANPTTFMNNRLKPGGFTLTSRAALLCSLTKESHVLDIGCGNGTTVEHLHRFFDIQAMGVDTCNTLLHEAKAKNPWATFLQSDMSTLELSDAHFDVIFAESILSLMDNSDALLQEAHRILRHKGWFIITDVYAKKPRELYRTKEECASATMRTLHDVTALKTKLHALGFCVAYFEECSEHLKALMVQIIFENGAIEQFWRKSVHETTKPHCLSDMIKRCQPGYFLLIAKKDARKEQVSDVH